MLDTQYALAKGDLYKVQECFMTKIDADDLLENIMAIGFPIVVSIFTLYDLYVTRNIPAYQGNFSLFPILIIIVFTVVFIFLNRLIFQGYPFFILILVVLVLLATVILRPYRQISFWPFINLIPAARNFLWPFFIR